MVQICASDGIECPVCGGRGTIRGRPWRPDRVTRYECALCAGAGSVQRSVVRSLLQLRQQMQRVADAMQAGQDDRAAKEARTEARLAFRLLA